MLHGREVERVQLAAVVDAARAGRAASLLVLGEPGVGKSALLDDLVASLDDVVVLRTQGVEAESPMAFAALHRLLRPVRDHHLPDPQDRALRVAFGEEPGSVEPFLVALATLSLLAAAAEERPVLCVVDDAHWLDGASADALLFAIRRLEADRVATVLAARDTDLAFAPEGVPVLPLGGLPAPAAREVLEARATAGVPAEVVDRLVSETRGNALALLELPAVLSEAQLTGAEPLPDGLPVTAGIERAFLDRWRRLSPTGRQVVLCAAIDDSGSLTVVRQAAEDLGAGLGDLDEAVGSGLLEVTGGDVAVRHPLVRSAVRQAASVAERQAAHRSLADALAAAGDPDRGTWHRSGAASAPDPGLADDLEDVGNRAERRGAFRAAADALERAATLSTDPEAAARRLLAAARTAWVSGQAARTSTLVESARGRTEDPLLLADLDRLRGRVAVNVGSAEEAHRVFTLAAQRVAAHDQVRALELAVAATVSQSHGIDSGARLPDGTVPTDPATDDASRTRCLRLLLRCARQDLAGDRASAVADLHAAVAVALDDPVCLADLDLLGNLGNAALHLGDDASCGRCYALMLSAARERGDAMAVLYALQRLAFPQYLAGQWSRLRASSEEAVSLGESLGQRAATAAPLAWLVLLSALEGREDHDDRLRSLEDLVAVRPPAGILAQPVQDLIRWARGVRALLDGDGAGALHHLRQVELPVLRTLATQDRVDAAVRAGETELAGRWVAELETYAGGTGLPWAGAAVAFGRALLAGSDGEELLAEAVAQHTRAQRPYDRARAQLAYGELLRRRQQRVEARRHLRAALATFDDLRAAPLAERAAQELRASGETARKRDPSTLVDLTPMELKVAALVSQGLSNKDVAAQCWISPRTVAFHLRNVFAKTGVTSRGELAQLDLA